MWFSISLFFFSIPRFKGPLKASNDVSYNSQRSEIFFPSVISSIFGLMPFTVPIYFDLKIVSS